jgi:hypothetical protein
MRRLVFTCALLGALAIPAAALAVQSDPGDGSLVVRGGDNGDGIGPGTRPVVSLVINGFVIGHVSGQGRIAIYDTDATDQASPEVTGATRLRDWTLQNGIAASSWQGTNFSFRAVGGTFKVVVWGSGVYVFASGQGKVTLTGSVDSSQSDGSYSLNGLPWLSIPLEATKTIASPPAAG